jgi:hypothetical protein
MDSEPNIRWPGTNRQLMILSPLRGWVRAGGRFPRARALGYSLTLPTGPKDGLSGNGG